MCVYSNDYAILSKKTINRTLFALFLYMFLPYGLVWQALNAFQWVLPLKQPAYNSVACSSRLERVQFKQRHDRCKVFHYFGLNTLVVAPVGISGETVKLYGEAAILRLESAHHYEHVLAYEWVLPEVNVGICAEKPCICVNCSVGKPFGIRSVARNASKFLSNLAVNICSEILV